MDIFKLVGSIFIDTEKADDSLAKTDEKAQKTGATFKDMAKKAVGIGTAVVGASTAAVGGMVKLAKDSASTADVIDKASQRMNIGAESYQELAHAASLSGVEMSTLEKAAKKLESTDLNLDQALEEIYALGTAEERSAKAAELFGDSVAYTLSPMLNATGEDMAAMRQEAHDLGLVMSEDAVTAGASLNDAISNVQDSFAAVVTQLGVSLMPVVQQLMDLVIQFMPVIQQGIDLIAPLLAQLFSTLLPPLIQIAQAILPVLIGTILPTLINLITAIMPILEPIFALLTPLINLVTTLLTPLLDLINLILPPIIKLGTSLAELLTKTITKAVEVACKVFNTLKTTVGNVFNALINLVRKPVNTIIGFINGLIRGIVAGVNGVIRALNRFSIKVPNWVTKLTGVQSFGFNLAEVSAPQIPLLAKGADIEQSGSAVVGEAGAELVELPKGARVTPLGSDSNLAEKIDTVIDLLRNFMNMGVYIDGNALVGSIGTQMDKELGRMAVRAGRWA